MSDLPTDFCCGLIPMRLLADGPAFLLVKHHAGHWGFPKGHQDPGETCLQTALRECLEETSLWPETVHSEQWFEERYIFTKRKSKKQVDKTVRYFLAWMPDNAVKMQAKEIAETAWGNAEETMQRLSFDAGKLLFGKVLAHLTTHGHHPPPEALSPKDTDRPKSTT